MQATAQGFLLYQLTHSVAYLGYLGFAAGIPIWLFTIYGGVVTDRISRRRLLVITQAAMMVLALILSLITWLGIVQPVHILILAFLLGVANAFDLPARQALVAELVPKEDLQNAITLSSAMMNLASATGPAFAGICYAITGAAGCFLINAFSFIAVIIALERMHHLHGEPNGKNIDQAGMRQAWRYIFTYPVIVPLMVIAGAQSFFYTSINTLMPAWSVKVLHGGADTYGLLLSLRGIGAVISALTLASFGRLIDRGRYLFMELILLPVTVLGFVLSGQLWLSGIVLVLIGFASQSVMNTANTLIQSVLTDEVRGRVMALSGMIVFGLAPVGALLVGLLAAQMGERTALLVMNINAFVVFGLIMLSMPRVRHLH